jgi:hypothetical protein
MIVGSILQKAGVFKNEQDQTEPIRRELVDEINSHNAERATVEAEYGQVWDTEELQQDFEVKSFAAPFCIVKRKSDGKLGSIMFQHMPRYYFNFQEN